MRKVRVSFMTTKKVARPVKVELRTGAGQPISFLTTKKVTTPVRIEFYREEKTHEGKTE